MAKSLRYHPEFESDVRDAADWYDQRSPNLGSDFVARMSRASEERDHTFGGRSGTSNDSTIRIAILASSEISLRCFLRSNRFRNPSRWRDAYLPGSRKLEITIRITNRCTRVVGGAPVCLRGDSASPHCTPHFGNIRRNARPGELRCCAAWCD